MRPGFLVFTLLLSVGSVYCQDADQWYDKPPSRWLMDVTFDWGFASNHFKRNMNDDQGFGAGAGILFNVQRKKPFWCGLGVHSFSMDDFRLQYSQEFDGIFYNYEDRTASRIFMLHGVVRFQPPLRFAFQPFVQGSAGINWFFTNTLIEDTDLGEVVERINENRDAVPGFALHAGIQYVPRRFPDIRSELMFGYFRNESVEYLRYNPDLLGVFPIDYFESKRSAVDMFGLHIGIATTFQNYMDVMNEMNQGYY